ncbi:hypothetical protein SDC9_177103 [bioreactor metagenome]|uniref:Uncharacterized protein n=1 Tax=bioreactor metagenome TaxID=1076179 RepID=A0A645GTL8_9ZZZZ
MIFSVPRCPDSSSRAIRALRAARFLRPGPFTSVRSAAIKTDHTKWRITDHEDNAHEMAGIGSGMVSPAEFLFCRKHPRGERRGRRDGRVRGKRSARRNAAARKPGAAAGSGRGQSAGGGPGARRGAR